MEDNKSSTVLCTSCLKENPVDTVYCNFCNYAFGVNASTDPVQMAISEGRSVGDGVLKPYKVIIVIGMWAVFFPGFAIFLFFSVGGFINSYENDIGGFIGSVISLMVSLFFGFFLFKTTRNYVRLRKELKFAIFSDSEEE